jgi:hypothetical protein
VKIPTKLGSVPLFEATGAIAELCHHESTMGYVEAKPVFVPIGICTAHGKVHTFTGMLLRDLR